MLRADPWASMAAELMAYVASTATAASEVARPGGSGTGPTMTRGYLYGILLSRMREATCFSFESS